MPLEYYYLLQSSMPTVTNSYSLTPSIKTPCYSIYIYIYIYIYMQFWKYINTVFRLSCTVLIAKYLLLQNSSVLAYVFFFFVQLVQTLMGRQNDLRFHVPSTAERTVAHTFEYVISAQQITSERISTALDAGNIAILSRSLTPKSKLRTTHLSLDD